MSDRFEAKSVYEVYSFGFFQGREYEALDTLKAMGAVGDFEVIQRDVRLQRPDHDPCVTARCACLFFVWRESFTRTMYAREPAAPAARWTATTTASEPHPRASVAACASPAGRVSSTGRRTGNNPAVRRGCSRCARRRRESSAVSSGGFACSSRR